MGAFFGKTISTEHFSLLGDAQIKIFVHCQICGKQKFDGTAVKLLSDKTLTLEEFKKTGIDRHQYQINCHDPACEAKYFETRNSYPVAIDLYGRITDNVYAQQVQQSKDFMNSSAFADNLWLKR